MRLDESLAGTVTLLVGLLLLLGLIASGNIMPPCTLPAVNPNPIRAGRFIHTGYIFHQENVRLHAVVEYYDTHRITSLRSMFNEEPGCYILRNPGGEFCCHPSCWSPLVS
jgi:hypothetical protein